MSKKPNEPSLSDNMKENILSYADEIRTIESFVEAVRQNPGYHLGSKGVKGLKNMAREIWQNSLDELDKKSSPCTWLRIEFDERTYGFTCEDNGRGIPFDNMLRIFMDPNTSSNYDKKPGEYSSGLHGVGSKIVNAMSYRFIVESYKFTGEARRVEFTDGKPWDKGELSIPNPEKKQGTMVYFEPSTDALGPIKVGWKEVYYWLVNILPLSSVGAKVFFTAYDANGKMYQETLVNDDGILTYLIKETETPMIAPIMMSRDTGTMKLDIAVTWDNPNSNRTGNSIVAFANKCPTIFGTHIDGFEAGVTAFFVNYMNKVYLASQKKKLTVVAQDIKDGLVAVITVAHLHPIFDGQSKEKLSNEDMKPFVKESVMDLLDKWANDHPKDLAIICRYFKDMAEIRLSVTKEKVKLTDKYNKSKLTGLPAKFIAPSDKNCKGREFFITEGDSAAGSLRNHRIHKTQGYFPIRGKLPNAFNTSKDKFLANAEVAGIIQIIGGGYGRNFDITKVKWDKIIFATDADPDGNHIKALLLRFFILYMPQLIEAGKVYAAMPPLYGVKVGNKQVYLRDRAEYVSYVQREFSKKNKVCYLTDEPVSQRELSKILYTNIDYVRTMHKISNRYAINPVLLETILTLYDRPAKEFDTKIKRHFRFIDNIDRSVPGTTMITGLVDSKYQTVIVNDTMLGECREILNLIDKNESLVYKVNDTIMSIYEMMSLFEKSAPSSIQRYKGLGEMKGELLFDSTIDPERRNLIQYTIENVKEEIEAIRFYENNKRSLLDDVKVTRFDVIE